MVAESYANISCTGASSHDLRNFQIVNKHVSAPVFSIFEQFHREKNLKLSSVVPKSFHLYGIYIKKIRTWKNNDQFFNEIYPEGVVG